MKDFITYWGSLSPFFFVAIIISTFFTFAIASDEDTWAETKLHLNKSIEYDNKATAIINKGDAYSVMAVEDSEQMIMYLKKAIEEAKKVNIEQLNARYPTWGDRYKNEYIEGLKLIIKGHENLDAQLSIEGQMKTNSYKNWISKIRKLF